MQRPAEELATRINAVIQQMTKGTEITLITRASLKQWHALAKRIDARMRLDGSPRSKQKRSKP